MSTANPQSFIYELLPFSQLTAISEREFCGFLPGILSLSQLDLKSVALIVLINRININRQLRTFF